MKMVGTFIRALIWAARARARSRREASREVSRGSQASEVGFDEWLLWEWGKRGMGLFVYTSYDPALWTKIASA